MKRIALIVALLALTVVWGSHAQELVTLTTPQTQTATSCSVNYLGLDLAANRIIVEVTLSPTGAKTSKVYDATTTPTGAALLTSLNRGNFSVNSLIRAVYARLSTDGVCTGTVSGVPQ
jgi:hypothetical protein